MMDKRIQEVRRQTFLEAAEIAEGVFLHLSLHPKMTEDTIILREEIAKLLREKAGEKAEQSCPISDVDSMIDPRDTPLIAKLGLDGVESAMKKFDEIKVLAVGKITFRGKGQIHGNYNYPSIFQKAIKSNVDDADFMYQASKAVPHLLRLVERMAFYGARMERTMISPRQSGGLGKFITDNVVKASGGIKKSHVDDLMGKIVIDGGCPDLLVMNPRIANDLRLQLDSTDYVRIIREGKVVALEKLETKYGELELVMDRWCPTDTAYILQSDKVGFYTLRPFEAYELTRSGESLKGEVVGELTLLVDEDKVHGKITEITT